MECDYCGEELDNYVTVVNHFGSYGEKRHQKTWGNFCGLVCLKHWLQEIAEGKRDLVVCLEVQ